MNRSYPTEPFCVFKPLRHPAIDRPTGTQRRKRCDPEALHQVEEDPSQEAVCDPGIQELGDRTDPLAPFDVFHADDVIDPLYAGQLQFDALALAAGLSQGRLKAAADLSPDLGIVPQIRLWRISASIGRSGSESLKTGRLQSKTWRRSRVPGTSPDHRVNSAGSV